MRNLSALSQQEAQAFFHPQGQHIPLSMRPLPHSRVVWINQRVMRQDPAFEICGGTLEAYSAHLLRACAYTIALEEAWGNDDITGVADRYGGPGIGHNGGSGRAAVINGYHVKGVGRTPLVGALTDEAHASGGAYLEECVRETIFSELAAAEFPGGTVPTLAIIDTGLVQVWDEDDGPRQERRCLLVRSAFVRPAHFERASSYISVDPKDGYADAQRVKHAFSVASKLWGQEALPAIYQNFWLTWAEQLAYAFAHRLPHGGDSTSNIALDGRLLDFGAMTATPSWARISLNWGSPPTGESVVLLVQAVKTHALFLGRFVDPALATPEAIGQTLTAAIKRYEHVLLREMLRLIGLTRQQAERFLQEEPSLRSLLGRLLTHYRREQFTIFDGTPSPRIVWDLEHFWSESPPAHWRPLRDFLESRIERLQVEGLPDVRQLAGCSELRGQSRPALYHERVKQMLYDVLEHQLKDSALNQESLDQLITETVCHNRRDSWIEPEEAIPMGFARSDHTSYALFKDLHAGHVFAIRECEPDVSGGSRSAHHSKIFIAQVTDSRIVFTDPTVPPFLGTVRFLRR